MKQGSRPYQQLINIQRMHSGCNGQPHWDTRKMKPFLENTLNGRWHVGQHTEEGIFKTAVTDHTWILIKTATTWQKCEYLLLEIREMFIFGIMKTLWKVLKKILWPVFRTIFIFQNATWFTVNLVVTGVVMGLNYISNSELVLTEVGGFKIKNIPH